MQEYWELYMKNLEGKPASIQFNAGISVEIDEIRESYPTIAFVKVKLKEYKESGLLTSTEEPEILYLEDKLEASLIKFRIGKYVGRVITDGFVSFLYYLQFTYNWDDFLSYALDEFAEYEISHGHQEDRQWNYYHKLLYPTAKEWQLIQNHKVCEQLKAGGDSLLLPRAIEHTLYFGEQCDREALIEQLTKEGFTIQKEIESPNGTEGISFYRKDRPHYYEIDTLTIHLVTMLESYDATYDGWETSIVRGLL